CTQLFGQRALRRELELEFACQILAFEFLVLADIRSDHLADLTGFQQLTQAKAVDARVIADAGQVLNPGIAQRRDQRLGNTAEAEAAHGDRLTIGHYAFQCFCGACKDFIHYTLPCVKLSIEADACSRCRRHGPHVESWSLKQRGHACAGPNAPSRRSRSSSLQGEDLPVSGSVPTTIFRA